MINFLWTGQLLVYRSNSHMEVLRGASNTKSCGTERQSQRTAVTDCKPELQCIIPMHFFSWKGTGCSAQNSQVEMVKVVQICTVPHRFFCSYSKNNEFECPKKFLCFFAWGRAQKSAICREGSRDLNKILSNSFWSHPGNKPSMYVISMSQLFWVMCAVWIKAMVVESVSRLASTCIISIYANYASLLPTCSLNILELVVFGMGLRGFPLGALRPLGLKMRWVTWCLPQHRISINIVRYQLYDCSRHNMTLQPLQHCWYAISTRSHARGRQGNHMRNAITRISLWVTISVYKRRRIGLKSSQFTPIPMLAG